MRIVTPRPSISPFARRYLARKKAILDAIEQQVRQHPEVRFQSEDGSVQVLPNSTDRDSLDPVVRSLWADLDQL